MDLVRDRAHLLLGLIRAVNGSAALLVPDAMARQAGADPAANPAAPYVLRLFGIRTVLIGLELLSASGPARRRALDRGVLIHASDTAAAALAGAAGQLPPGAARKAVAISALNTTLALIARRR